MINIIDNIVLDIITNFKLCMCLPIKPKIIANDNLIISKQYTSIAIKNTRPISTNKLAKNNEIIKLLKKNFSSLFFITNTMYNFNNIAFFKIFCKVALVINYVFDITLYTKELY